MGKKKEILVVPHPPKFELGLDRRIHIKRVCQVSGETIEFSIPLADYSSWKKYNNPIHLVFHYLSADQREMMLSGFTPKEWEYLMKGEDE